MKLDVRVYAETLPPADELAVRAWNVSASPLLRVRHADVTERLLFVAGA